MDPLSLETLTQAGENLSLILVIAALVLFGVMASRARRFRSLQVQMFAVLVVLFAGEVPHILGSLGLVNLSGIQDLGLGLHTVSMVILSAFLLYRIYGFLRSG